MKIISCRRHNHKQALVNSSLHLSIIIMNNTKTCFTITINMIRFIKVKQDTPQTFQFCGNPENELNRFFEQGVKTVLTFIFQTGSSVG